MSRLKADRGLLLLLTSVVELCAEFTSVFCVFPVSSRGEDPRAWHKLRTWKPQSAFRGAADPADGQPGSGLLCHLSNQ